MTTAGRALADVRLLPDPGRAAGPVPLRLEPRRLRPAEHDATPTPRAPTPSSTRWRWRLGVDRLGDWANGLGFGEKQRHPAAGRGGRHHRQPRVGASQGREDVFTGELAQAGIGQNVIAVTPLQLLNAYAALANGGHLMRADDRPRRDRRRRQAGQGSTSPRSSGARRQPGQPADHAASARARSSPPATRTTSATCGCRARCRGKTGTAEFGARPARASSPSTRGSWPTCRRAPGATDADLAIVTFSYSAVVPGNVSLEVVKYFLQQWYDLDQDLRLDPATSLVAAN